MVMQNHFWLLHLQSYKIVPHQKHDPLLLDENNGWGKRTKMCQHHKLRRKNNVLPIMRAFKVMIKVVSSL